MRRIRTAAILLGLLYFPAFLAFMSYDLWLWWTAEMSPAGPRIAAVHQHGKARYVTPAQARARDVLEVGVIILFGFLAVSAAVPAVTRAPDPRSPSG
jgi:hypothetical protein